MTKSEGSAEAGRRVGRSGRKSYTLEEKRRIVEATQVAGASVSKIAREHDINTNLIFTWRRQHARGELVGSQGSRRSATLLPVCIAPKGASAAAEAAAEAVTTKRAEAKGGVIEIELPGGCIRIHGPVERDALRQMLDALQRR